MSVRSLCWVGLGALSVACATGTFGGGPPRVAVEEVGASEGATTIKGVVYDADTGDPLHGTVLLLDCDCIEGQQETRTNTSGIFAFSGLPAGTYAIRVVHMNGDVTKSVSLEADHTVRLRFVVSTEPNVLT
ncbi:MAG: carboxypeptidase-like regulatory domain-containing protein [Nannocystaceae bacterium]|nr:carboxypeptidase-like regulatory domain-containing protein [Nannocystaceae bacterium]